MSLVAAVSTTSLASANEPINILFIGNSFTHGRFEEVRLFNAENAYVDCPAPQAADSSA